MFYCSALNLAIGCNTNKCMLLLYWLKHDILAKSRHLTKSTVSVISIFSRFSIIPADNTSPLLFWFVSPPENDSFRKDLCFWAWCFLIFFPREIFEMRGLTGVKFCRMVSTRPYYKIGAHRKKISGAKNMQNLARFRTTSKFGGEYLRNGWRYSKSDFYYRDSSRVRQNKSGEVRSSDLGDLGVESYPPKMHYSKDHISAPRGCCAPKFLQALENDQVLLAHPPPGTAAPLTIFFQAEDGIRDHA